VRKLKIPWSKPDWGEEEKKAVQRVLDSGWLTMGRETEAFERELAEVTGLRYNVFMNSGTSAITAAIIALDGFDGEPATIPTYSFYATINAVRAAGVKDIRYGSVDRDTGLLLREEAGKYGGVVVPIHYAGHPLDQQLWKDAKRVVEDAAEAFGARVKNPSNTFWDRIVCYSFHVAKTITTIEGGCASTDDVMLADMLRAVRNQGLNPLKRWEPITRGFNFKPLDINAAVGRVQLRKLEKYLENRGRIASTYREELEGLVGFQRVEDYVAVHANTLFPVYVRDPEGLADWLSRRGVETRLGWVPMVNWCEDAWWLSTHTVFLPIYNTMTVEEALYVCDAVKEWVADG